MIYRIVNKTKNTDAVTGIGKTGRAIASYLPKTVELGQMHTSIRRILIITIELLVGFLVIGAFLLGLFYYRLEKGAIDLNFIVPSIESAINDQLSGLSIKIKSAYVGKNTHSSGVHFRLRNIVLANKQGKTIATAPLAAVDLNGRALMWGRLAPSQMVFIKPTLDIAYNKESGLSLSYPNAGNSNDGIGDLLRENNAPNTDADSQINAPTTIAKLEIMKAITAAFEEARSHSNTTSYLTQFGVRDARVRYSNDGTDYSWKIPDFIIDLKHSNKSSLIRGFGKIGIGEKNEQIKPWNIRFQTKQSDNTQDLQLDFGFKDITPASLQRLLPNISVLKHFDIPFDGKVNAKLNNQGEVQSAFANIRLAAGKISFPWLDKSDGIESVNLDIGELKIAYTKNGNKLLILPSLFKWGNNQTNLSGIVQLSNSSSNLNFTLKGQETRLAAKDFDLAPVIIDEWWVTGSINPDTERVEIAGLFLRAGNATINLKGYLADFDTSPGIYLRGKLSSISVPVLKRLWPRILAIEARKWVGEKIHEGQVVSGDFKVAIPAGVLAKLPVQGDLAPKMVRLNLKLSDLLVKYHDGLLPLKIPDATLKITGRQLSIDIPKGRIHLGKGSPLKLSHGNYSISDLREEDPVSNLSFRLEGKAQDLIKFINQPALKSARKTGYLANRIDGNLKGVVNMHIPLKDNLQFNEIGLDGNLRLTKMKSKKLFGDMSVEGGSINIKLSEKAVEADGGVVIKGIPVKINWQRIFGTRKAKQPPIRLSAILSKTSRRKLGLSKLNSLLKGDIPVVITVSPSSGKSSGIQVRADLTNAKLSNEMISWTKYPGTAAVLQFDVKTGKKDIINLENFSLVGNQLVLEGALAVNGKNSKLHSFHFPNFSFNHINNMNVAGKRNKNGVLDITAKIQNLDGRRLLRNQFFGNSQTRKKTTSSISGFDYNFHAEIGTIAGGKGAYISGARVDIKQRRNKVSLLDFKGRLNGQSMIAMRIEPKNGTRRVMKVESTDAGTTFRMIGLYPNIQGGQLSLKVNLDGKRSKGNRGTLWVKDFFVISSQKISGDVNSASVFQNELIRENRQRSKSSKPKIVKTKMQFDQLKAPFSYGNGQFILHDSYVNGPVIGATLRGKIDFRTETMRLGGTYVPLYGLNAAIGEIPVLRDLLVGRKGEGVFGVTFAIEGPTAKPTVIVNPVSLLTPGVFRQIFDFNNTVKDQQFRKLPKKRRRDRGKRPRNGESSY